MPLPVKALVSKLIAVAATIAEQSLPSLIECLQEKEWLSPGLCSRLRNLWVRSLRK